MKHWRYTYCFTYLGQSLPGILGSFGYQQTGFGAGNEIQLTDAIRRLIREGHKVYGMRLRKDEKRYDIGNFGAYFRAFVEFSLADEKYGADLKRHLEGLLDVDHT